MNLIKNIMQVPTLEFQNKITFFANHLLVVLAFLSPLYFRATSSVVFILLILLIVRRNYLYYFKEALSNKIVQAILLFILINILWLYGSDNLLDAKTELINLKYYLYSILFLLFVDKKFVYAIISGFILGMLFSESISYLIHFNLLPYKLELYNTIIYESQGVNNPSPFLNHSQYNVLLSIAIGFMLYNLLKNDNKILIKFISVFFIVTASVNLILVGGRIGYISYIVIIMLVLFLVYKMRIFKIVLPISFLLLTLFFYLAYNHSSQFKLRIENTISDKEKLINGNKENFKSSIGLRIGFWLNSVDVIKENLIFGVGTGDHMNSVAQNLPKEHKYIVQMIEHPHNEYLKILLQFGILGFIFFLNIFYQIFKLEDNDFKNYLVILTCGVCCLLLTDIFVKNILIIFLLFISVCTSKANYLKDYIFKFNIKIIIMYILLISIFLLVVLLEKVY